MAWIGKLFGTERAVDAVIGKEGLIAKAGGWWDRKEYTEEERAEGRLESQKQVVEYLNALAPFKVMQRYLMMVLSSVWALLILQVCASIWFNNDAALAALIELCSSPFVWGPTAGGFSLYLGGGSGLPMIGKK